MSIYDFETRERRLSVLADTPGWLTSATASPTSTSSCRPPTARHRGLRLVPRVLPRHGQQHDQADVMTAAGRDDIEVCGRSPAPSAAERRSCARSRTSSTTASRQPAAARPRGARQAALLRRLGIPLIYSPAPIAGATAPITHRRPHRAGRRRVALRLVIHQLRRPGSPLLTGMGPVKLDMNTVQALYNSPSTTPRTSHHRDGQVDGHPQLGLRRHQRLAVRRRQRRHRHHRAHAALHAGRLEPQPRHRLPRLRPLRAGSSSCSRRGHLDEPARARGHRVRDETLALDTSPRSARAATSSAKAHKRHVRKLQCGRRSSTAAPRKNWEADGSPDATEKAHRKLLDIRANTTGAAERPT